MAEAQTFGRGRLGREWFSPLGAGLYVSIVLRPDGDPSALLTLAAGVALAEGVQNSTGLPTEIKWPNDLLVGGRKLAGILTEATAQGDGIRFIILGFGVNLRPAAYPPELAGMVTSIEAEIDRQADRAAIFSEILAALWARYDDLQQRKFDAILSAWRRRAFSVQGSLVEWDAKDGVRRGRAEGIDDTGALIVRADGIRERVIAGTVRWIQRNVASH